MEEPEPLKTGMQTQQLVLEPEESRDELTEELLGELPPLTEEQNKVLHAILEGHNVFFTGPAGSGKSLIIRHLKGHLKRRQKSFEITAPTGVAAAQLGGSTIHRFARIRTGEESVNEYIKLLHGGAPGKEYIEGLLNNDEEPKGIKGPLNGVKIAKDRRNVEDYIKFLNGDKSVEDHNSYEKVRVHIKERNSNWGIGILVIDEISMVSNEYLHVSSNIS